MTLLNTSVEKKKFSTKLENKQMGFNDSVCVHCSNYA